MYKKGEKKSITFWSIFLLINEKAMICLVKLFCQAVLLLENAILFINAIWDPFIIYK
jgi:hypothetical protein